ncbi:MAG: sugar ABC transporter permease [Candidatus Limivivens sp.]|nr:sugar ABC transporter permease [Candidatus Limivivens sp.]
MKKRRVKEKVKLSSFLFTLPSLVFFSIALLIPFFMGINIAFTDWNGVTKDYNYVGLANFIRMFSDSRMVAPIKNTLILAVIGVIVNNVVTLGLALLFTKFRGKFGSICRLIVFVPCCLSGVLSAYVWKFIFRFVLSAMTGLSSPLGSMFWVLPGIVVIGLWNGAGINMLIYYAALKNVPTDLVEAAIVDGAGRLAVFKNITLPMIAPAFTTCVTMTFTAMLKEFGTVMSATGGGPARASETISMYIYDNLYTYSRAGYGQAISFAFLAFLILIGNLMTNFFRKREVEM